MPTRRHLLLQASALAALLLLPVLPPGSARAQGAGMAPAQADRFLRQFGDQLIAIINSDATAAQKRARLVPIVDANVDVAGIAQFCLGRFWRLATPPQQAEFVRLFHQVLLTSITGHLGEYRGVTYTMTGTQDRGGDAYVGTIIHRPGAADANVQWVVSSVGGRPQIVDVVAEGTSLRLTQRSDYASFMSRNSDSIAALLAALRRQAAA